MPFFTDEMRAAFEPGGAAAEMIRQRAESDPAFAEDVASLMESKDWFTRWPGGGGAAPGCECECCGTRLVQLEETGWPLSQPVWKPALWEDQSGRRHTLRRCNWQREQVLGRRRGNQD